MIDDPDKLESKIERECCDFAFSKWWLELKVVSPSRRGVPDRFYARYRHGIKRVMFVEYKRPGYEPTEQQKNLHREMREYGLEVYIISSLAQARRLFA